MKIGYFGGTFDPPHLGHVILAAEAIFQLELDALHWILTPFPPHKNSNPVTPVEIRLDILDLVVNRHPGFEISHVDLTRDPPHYASDTVEILKAEKPSYKLVYLIGGDSLRDLPDWHKPARFLQDIDQLAVASRPHIETDLDALEHILPGLEDKIVFLSETSIDISSSFIRQRIKGNGPYSHFVTQAVYQYLEDNQLYR